VAKVVKEKGYDKPSGGSEATLHGFGSFFYTMAFIGCVAFLVLLFSTAKEVTDVFGINSTIYDWNFLMAAVYSLLSGLLAGAILRAGADVVRLLKKMNGIEYSGSISAAKRVESVWYKCSECGASLPYLMQRCEKCGATLSDEAE
jgi:hypothetical protein